MTPHQKQTSHISLARLKKGTKARIVEVTAGKQMSLRLSTLGLRLGAQILKINAFALRGPVTVKIGSTIIALGHGMAEKVLVEPHL
jgi:Fe2+ transport system protein FeoA